MNELDVIQKFFALLFLGLALGVVYGLMFPLSKLVASALAWVDDKEHKGFSPMLLFVARLLGYKPDGDSEYRFINGKGHNKDKYDLAMQTVFLIFCAPAAIYLAIKFYPIPLAAALLYAIAHTARFARRHKKLFDEHVKDPGAHK